MSAAASGGLAKLATLLAKLKEERNATQRQVGRPSLPGCLSKLACAAAVSICGCSYSYRLQAAS